MAVFNEPSKWQTSLVNSGDANVIPQSTPVGTGEASFEEGFPQITQVPIGAGGQAPDRKDFNGLFKVLGDWIFFNQNGGLPTYSADFDYVVGRYVVYNNTLYKCIQANGASSTIVAPDSVSPLGTDYWKDIENQDSTSLIPNQIIQSPVPLTDANLHLLDGALLSGSGAYSEYVTMMGKLYNADPTATYWTDEATWQASVSQYGICGKFVYDSVNNTLRLPKLGDYLISDIPSELGVKGNGISMGFTDGTTNFGIDWHRNGTTDNIFEVFIGDYGLPVGSTRGAIGTPSDKVSGLTPDVTKSGVIADTQNLSDKAVNVYYYIVIGTISKTDIQINIDNVMSDLALKADNDLSNVTAPTQAFKDMSIGWGMPDYSAGVSVSLVDSQLNFTASTNGYFVLSGLLGTLYINGLQVGFMAAYTGWDGCISTIILNKGDVVTTTGIVSGYQGTFFPCKGA